MKRLTWYFDFVSPFSYLQLEHQLPQLPDEVGIDYRPVLFAGLLKHYGQLGPAEIPAKRRFTYRYVLWLGRRFGVPVRIPKAHPFNPLPLLRLAIAAGPTAEAVRQIFRFVWREGRLPDEANAIAELARRLDLDVEAAEAPEIKEALRANGDEAIAAGVFGVPSFVVDGYVFWGVDGFAMLSAYLENTSLFDDPDMRRAEVLPSAAERER